MSICVIAVMLQDKLVKNRGVVRDIVVLGLANLQSTGELMIATLRGKPPILSLGDRSDLKL